MSALVVAALAALNLFMALRGLLAHDTKPAIIALSFSAAFFCGLMAIIMGQRQ